MRISLEEFIRSGQLGPIKIGLSRNEVKTAFGEPNQWHSKSPSWKTANIWKYGDTEFHFRADKLWMIFFDEFDIPNVGDKLELDAWGLSNQVTLSQMESKLKVAEINYHCEQFSSDNERILLVSQAKTTLSFERQNDETLHLYSIFSTS